MGDNSFKEVKGELSDEQNIQRRFSFAGEACSKPEKKSMPQMNSLEEEVYSEGNMEPQINSLEDPSSGNMEPTVVGKLKKMIFFFRENIIPEGVTRKPFPDV